MPACNGSPIRNQAAPVASWRAACSAITRSNTIGAASRTSRNDATAPKITLGSNAESEDVVQETFITAWEKLPTLKDGDHLKAWLMRVVRNKSIDRLRKRRPVTVEIDENMPTLVGSPFAVVETLLQNRALSLAVSRLPTNQRRAWVMREFSGGSYSVIASELGVPESTVRGLLARSRHTLARELAAWN